MRCDILECMNDEKRLNQISKTLFIIFLLSLIPIVLISPSVYPFSDDFTLGAYTYHAFIEDRSIIHMIRNALINTYDVYQEWQGTYTTIFLMSIEPGVFGYRYYHLTPILIIASFCLALYYLIYVLVERIAGATRPVTIIMFSVLALLIIQNSPDPAQAFCWWTGAVHYTTGDALWFLFYGKLMTTIKSASEKRSIGPFHFVLLCLLAFLAGGVNNITIVWAFMLLVTTEGAMILLRLPFEARRITIPVHSCLMAGILLNILCPGAMRRLSLQGGNSNGIIRTILRCFPAGGLYLLRWTNGTIILLIILLIPASVFIVKGIRKKSGFHFPLPGIVCIYAYCLFSGMYAPLLYVDDAHDLRRIHVGIYPFYVLLIAFCTFYMTGWILSKKVLNAEKGLEAMRKHLLRYYVAALSLMAAICVYMTLSAPARFTTTSCLVSLLNGNAQKMRDIMEYNFKQLEDPEVRDVYVYHAPMDSSMLTSDEIADWKDGAVLFYQKDSVTYME